MPSTGPAAFPISWVGGLPVISCPAEIDIASADGLAAAIREAAAVQSTIVVDLTATTFCDCSALRVLVPAQQRAAARGGDLRLVIRTSRVRRLFALTGLDRMFASYSGVSAATEPCGPPKPSPPARTSRIHTAPEA